MKKCKKCGADLKPGIKFCTKCGTPVDGDVESDSTVTISEKKKESAINSETMDNIKKHSLNYFPKLQEQISHTINPIKSVFSLIFIFYGLNLTGGSSGEKLFGCLIASLPAR